MSAPDANGWLPIETAPKDGTWVDLWIEGGRVPEAWWGYPHHECGEAGMYCDSCPSHEGWCDDFGYLTGDDEPTHWRHTPKPPVAS